MSGDDIRGVSETSSSVQATPADSQKPIKQKEKKTYIGNVKKQGKDLGKELLYILPKVGTVCLSFFIALGGGGGVMVAKTGELFGIDTSRLYSKSRTMALLGTDSLIIGVSSLVLRTATKVVNVLAAVTNQEKRWSAVKKKGVHSVLKAQKKARAYVYNPTTLDAPTAATVIRYIGDLRNFGQKEDKTP